MIIEEDNVLSLVNGRFEELSGYSRGEIEGKKSWMEFVSPADREKLGGYHRELLKPGGWTPATCSFCFLNRDKKAMPAALSLRKIPGTARAIASITDTTIQTKLEGLLRANEERYRVLVNNLSLGMYKNRLEAPGKLLWANPALIHMFGYDSLADFMRQPTTGFYADPRDRERFIEELRKTGYVRDFEVLQKKKDGTPFWVRISALPKKNRHGEVEWIEGTVEDIDTCKVTIDACQQKNLYLSEILESAVTVGIISTDTAGTITIFNRGAERMLGYTAGEVVGKQTPLIFHPEEEVAARAKALTQDAGQPVAGFEVITRQARATGIEEREWTYVKKDGTRIIVNLTVATVTARDGEAQGFLFTVKEITDKKTARRGVPVKQPPDVGGDLQPPGCHVCHRP